MIENYLKPTINPKYLNNYTLVLWNERTLKNDYLYYILY